MTFVRGNVVLKLRMAVLGLYFFNKQHQVQITK